METIMGSISIVLVTIMSIIIRCKTLSCHPDYPEICASIGCVDIQCPRGMYTPSCKCCPKCRKDEGASCGEWDPDECAEHLECKIDPTMSGTCKLKKQGFTDPMYGLQCMWNKGKQKRYLKSRHKKSFVTATEEECKQLCETSQGCQSIEYDGSSCYLNKYNRHSMRQRFKKSEKFTYFDYTCKAESCPNIPEDTMGICVEDCSSDQDCTSPDKKCCSTGCGHACIVTAKTTSFPDAFTGGMCAWNNIEKNHRLAGKDMTTYKTAMSSEKCTLKCQKFLGCQSFDYETSDKKCSINYKNKITMPSDFRFNRKFSYRDFKCTDPVQPSSSSLPRPGSALHHISHKPVIIDWASSFLHIHFILVTHIYNMYVPNLCFY